MEIKEIAKELIKIQTQTLHYLFNEVSKHDGSRSCGT
jgi:hypothetical protein